MVDPQQAAWQRQAVFSNLAAQGAAVQTVLPGEAQYYGGSTQPQKGAWDTWAGTENQRMDMEGSSANSIPNAAYKAEHSPPTAEASMEAEGFPKMETSSR